MLIFDIKYCKSWNLCCKILKKTSSLGFKRTIKLYRLIAHLVSSIILFSQRAARIFNYLWLKNCSRIFIKNLWKSELRRNEEKKITVCQRNEKKPWYRYEWTELIVLDWISSNVSIFPELPLCAYPFYLQQQQQRWRQAWRQTAECAFIAINGWTTNI